MCFAYFGILRRIVSKESRNDVRKFASGDSTNAIDTDVVVTVVATILSRSSKNFFRPMFFDSSD